MITQLALGVGLRDDATFKNFFIGENQQVFCALQELVQGRGENFIYLWGDKGVGITHLLQACCHATFDYGRNAIYLNLSEQQLLPAVLQDLETIDVICVDAIESIIGKPAWEEALLYLYNRVRDGSACLVIGARQLPKGLPCKLLDLKSRLAWGLVLKLDGLTEVGKLHALQMRATQRGFALAENTCQFLLRSYPEDTTALFDALEKLDKASLAAKRKITIPFIKKILVL